MGLYAESEDWIAWFQDLGRNSNAYDVQKSRGLLSIPSYFAYTTMLNCTVIIIIPISLLYLQCFCSLGWHAFSLIILYFFGCRGQVGLKSKPARHTSERLKIHKVYLCHLVNLYCFEDRVSWCYHIKFQWVKGRKYKKRPAMPVRQMKESSEQHLVIKTHMQNSMNQPQKHHKTAQNGKGPPQPLQESSNTKPQNQASPPAKNRGRRRGRGGRKSDQGDVCTRPSSRPCTVAHKPVLNPTGDLLANASNGHIENSKNVCEMEMGLGFPTSSKSLSLAPRPGYGQVGTKCIVKANHFLAELPDKDLNQYDVSSILWMQWRKDVVFCFFSFFLPVFSFEFVIFTIWALNLTLSLQIIPPPPPTVSVSWMGSYSIEHGC